MKLDQSVNEFQSRTSNGGHAESERPHLQFESMMRELIAHRQELAAIADKKPLPHRLRFLAEIHLWLELGGPSQEVWQSEYASDDFQTRLRSLEVADHSWLYDWLGFVVSDGKLIIANSML
jgi:hypothetical protein